MNMEILYHYFKNKELFGEGELKLTYINSDDTRLYRLSYGLELLNLKEETEILMCSQTFQAKEIQYSVNNNLFSNKIKFYINYGRKIGFTNNSYFLYNSNLVYVELMINFMLPLILSANDFKKNADIENKILLYSFVPQQSQIGYCWIKPHNERFTILTPVLKECFYNAYDNFLEYCADDFSSIEIKRKQYRKEIVN